MAMSRRKQLHPKSLKKDDEMLFVLPDEVKYDEKSNEIITRINLQQNHHFGPFPAIFQIEDQIESFQLLDIKHNWLVYCSILNKSSGNLNLIFQNNQLFVIVKESIPIGTRLYTNKIILSKLNMNKNILIKEEPIETEIQKFYPLVFICETCGIRFRNRNTLDAHRQLYCMQQETTQNSRNTHGVKRKCTDDLSLTRSAKRLSNDAYYSECDILLSKSDNLRQDKFNSCKLNNKTLSLNHPIQIGQLIYVPIPIRSSEIDNKPLDLSKPKKINNQCKFCSINFRSLKTLHAHQENYCIDYQKQNSRSSLFICRLCKYQGNNLEEMRIHLKFHLLNNQSCSDDDIIKNSITNEFLLKCTICLAMFNNEEILLNHIKCVHTNEKLIQCLECQSSFCSKWNLIRHMKLLHTDIEYDHQEDEKSSNSMNLNRQFHIKKIFSCPFCHIKFGNIDTLKQHMTNYCSSRPYMKKTITYCSSCQISFQHKTSYDAHKMYYCRNGSKTNVNRST